MPPRTQRGRSPANPNPKKKKPKPPPDIRRITRAFVPDTASRDREEPPQRVAARIRRKEQAVRELEVLARRPQIRALGTKERASLDRRAGKRASVEESILGGFLGRHAPTLAEIMGETQAAAADPLIPPSRKVQETEERYRRTHPQKPLSEMGLQIPFELSGRLGEGAVKATLGLPAGLAALVVEPEETSRAVGGAYAHKYGPAFRGDFGETLSRMGEDPFGTLLDATAAASLAASPAKVGTAVSAYRQTGSLPTALRAARVAPSRKHLLIDEQGKPHRRPRNLRVGAEAVEGGVILHPPGSANTLTTHFQDIYDRFSERHPGARLVGADSRGARLKARQLHTEQERIRARVQPLERAIGHIAFNKVTNRRLRTRLYYEAHLPLGLRGDEGLQTVLASLRESKTKADVGELRERFEAVDSQYQAFVDRVAAKIDPYSAAELRTETALRNKQRGKFDRQASGKTRSGRWSGASSKKVQKRPKTIRQEVRDEAEDQIERTIAANPDTPAAQKLRALIDEHAELQEALNAYGEASIFGDSAASVTERLSARFGEGYRAKRLRKKAGALEDALSQPVTKEYQAALDALRQLSDERKAILIEAGLLDPVTAAAREALLARHLFGEDAGPSGIYVPHKAQKSLRASVGGFVRGPLGGGPASKTGLGVGKQNELVLYREGRNLVDPDLVLLSWHRAQVFDIQSKIKGFLWDVGEAVPASGPRPGAYLVNRDGKTTPRFWKDMEEGDPDALMRASEDYASKWLGQEGAVDSSFYGPNGKLHPGVRQVDPKFVHAFFNRLVGPGGTGAIKAHAVGRWVDVVNVVAKAAILWANPGYIPANFTANLALLGLHQGVFAIPNLLRSGQVLAKDRELARLIRAEVGSGPTLAIAADAVQGGRLSHQILQGERRAASGVSAVADVWPRMAAWEYEARRAGFKSRADQIRLLTDDSDPVLVNTRNDVSARSTEAMVNFDRLTPVESAVLRRVFFVWPWIRGATAWAGRMPKEFPVRSAVLAEVGEQGFERQKELLGNLPTWLAQSAPLGAPEDGIASVIPGGPISPFGVVAEQMKIGRGIYRGLTEDEPLPKYETPWGMVNPVLSFAVEVFQPDPFGEGFRSQLGGEASELAPQYKLVRELIDPEQAPAVYAERTRMGTLKRRVGRVLPTEINLAEANAAAEGRRSGKSDDEKLREWMAGAEKVWRQTGNEGPLPLAVIRPRQTALLYTSAERELKRQVGAKKLSLKQQLALMFGVLVHVDNSGSYDREELKALVRNASPTEVEIMLPRARKAFDPEGILERFNRLRRGSDLARRERSFAQR